MLQLLQDWLRNLRRRWMIVLDNVDDATFLLAPPDAGCTTKRRIDYVPTSNHGFVLLTSRYKTEAYKLVSESNVLDVLPMDLQHARTLLQKKLGSLYTEKSCSQLAEALDFMPLAISQAASYIRQKRRYTVESYLAELEKSREARTSLLRRHGTVPQRDRDASSSIILTWQISFEHVHSTRRSSADLLALMSFCDRQAIPEILLRGVHDQESGETDTSEDDDYDESEFDDDIQMLEDFSFVSPNSDSTSWDMHRLVQDATQSWLLDRGEVEVGQNRFIKHLDHAIPINDEEHWHEKWQTMRVLMPHVLSALGLNVHKPEVALHSATVMSRVACLATLGGLYSDAECLAERSLHIRANELGPDHAETLGDMETLACVYQYQERWDEAEILQLKVVRASKAALGAEHLKTLVLMQELAIIYQFQGRWKEAEELQVEGRETSKRVFGADHSHTLDCMSHLALPLMKQERWKEAEELQLKVMETSMTKFGAEHHKTLEITALLARNYLLQGRLKEAEDLQIKILNISKTVFGIQYPDTLIRMRELAKIYRLQERLQDAQSLMQECVRLQIRTLGTTHRRTRECVEWLEGIEAELRAGKGDEIEPTSMDSNAQQA